MKKLLLDDERGTVLIVELIVLAGVLAAAGFAAYQYTSHKNAVSQAAKPKPHVTAKPSPSPTPTPTPQPTPAHTAAEAKSLVERLYNGYNVNAISRDEIEANSTSAVKTYIQTYGGMADPINCTQNNHYTMAYSDPVVSGTTAVVTVSEERIAQVQVSVDLNSLLISKIHCV